jgi:parafibromin
MVDMRRREIIYVITIVPGLLITLVEHNQTTLISLPAKMSTNDPLQSLRQAIQSRSSINYADASGASSPSLASATHLVLSPTLSLAKSGPTRYLKPGASKDFFSLEAIYLAWLLRDAPGADYMKQARENGLAVGFVSVTERKGVVDWLEGRGGGEERVVPLSGKL